MAFKPAVPIVGTRVRLDENVNVLTGTFERGTYMTIIGRSERGYDLVDDDGNNLFEYGVIPGPAKFTIV